MIQENEIINLSDFIYYVRVYVCHCSQKKASQDIGMSLTYFKSLESGKYSRKRTSFTTIEKIALWARKEPNYVNLLKKGKERTIDKD